MPTGVSPGQARHLLRRAWGIVMRFATTSTATLAAGLAARLFRPLARGSALRVVVGPRQTRGRGVRYAAAALALGLGLNSIGLCLCGPAPVRAAQPDPHSCCPKPANHDTGKPPAGTVINASASCCGSQTSAPAFVARIEARDVAHYSLTSVAAAYIPPDAPAAPSTLGASASFVRGASPPLTPVLRI